MRVKFAAMCSLKFALFCTVSIVKRLEISTRLLLSTHHEQGLQRFCDVGSCSKMVPAKLDVLLCRALLQQQESKCKKILSVFV